MNYTKDKSIINLFSFLILISFLLPMNQHMPSYGLDPSWKYVMDYGGELPEINFVKD